MCSLATVHMGFDNHWQVVGHTAMRTDLSKDTRPRPEVVRRNSTAAWLAPAQEVDRHRSRMLVASTAAAAAVVDVAARKAESAVGSLESRIALVCACSGRYIRSVPRTTRSLHKQSGYCNCLVGHQSRLQPWRRFAVLSIDSETRCQLVQSTAARRPSLHCFATRQFRCEACPSAIAACLYAAERRCPVFHLLPRQRPRVQRKSEVGSAEFHRTLLRHRLVAHRHLGL